MNYYGIIYSAKNLTNNKRYIGQTTCALEKRKREHINSISQQKYSFQKAMKKYGTDNFYGKFLIMLTLLKSLIIRKHIGLITLELMDKKDII